MFGLPLNLVLYISAAFFSGWEIISGGKIPLLAGIATFFAYDMIYVLAPGSFRGRSVENILSQANMARQHISYFLPFYGVMFGILFASDPQQRGNFAALVQKAGLPTWELLLPFIASCVVMLFIPVKVARSNDERPTTALKSLLFVTAFGQNIAIFVLLISVVQLLRSTLPNTGFLG